MGIESTDMVRLLVRKDSVRQSGIRLCGHGVLWHRRKVCRDGIGGLRVQRDDLCMVRSIHQR